MNICFSSQGVALCTKGAKECLHLAGQSVVAVGVPCLHREFRGVPSGSFVQPTPPRHARPGIGRVRHNGHLRWSREEKEGTHNVGCGLEDTVQGTYY